MPQPQDRQNDAPHHRSSRMSSYYTGFNINLKDTLGFRIRQTFRKFKAKAGPILRNIIPNFMVAHYTYIILMVIIGSIMMYPTKNLRYIDCLLFASGSATGAGLNPVDINNLTLFQQMVLYIIATLTTPIFVHSAVALLRLFWFEKAFDDIKQRSRMNFERRRTATLATFRTQTMGNATLNRTNTMRTPLTGTNTRSTRPQHQRHEDGFGTHNASEELNRRLFKSNHADHSYINPEDEEGKLDMVLEGREFTIPGFSSSGTATTNESKIKRMERHENNIRSDDIEMASMNSQSPGATDDNSFDYILHQSEPNEESEDKDEYESRRNRPDPNPRKDEDKDIRFANLPKQPRRRYKEIEPRDLNMSISMMQHNKPQGPYTDESGPALVNKGLGEREGGTASPLPGHKHGRKAHLRYMRQHKRELRERLTKQRQMQDELDAVEAKEELPSGQNDGNNSGITADDLARPKTARDTLIQFQDTPTPMKRGASYKTEKADGMSAISRLATGIPLSFSRTSAPSSTTSASPDIVIDDADDSALSFDSDVGEASGSGETDDDDGVGDCGENFRNVGRTQPRVVTSSGSRDKAFPNLDFKINKRAKTLDDVTGQVTPKEPQSRKPNIVKPPTFDKTIRKSMRNRASGKFAKLSRNFTRTRSGLVRLGTRTATGGSNIATPDVSDEGLISLHFRRANTNPNYLSWTPTVGRNSTFVAFTDQQKDELGGVEYRAVKLLIFILVAYYVGCYLMGIVMFVPFINIRKNYDAYVRSVGVSPTWWGFFTPMSCFTDVGFALTPDSMISFRQNAYIMLTSSFFIVAGNTGFPILLRFIIWVMYKLSRPLSLRRESLAFLLDHPRRCFTLLFPSGPTWWLLFVLVLLNVIDWMLFLILDFHRPILASIPPGYRVLDGLFQAFSTRTAGFAIVDLSALNPAIQVSYLIMMYISVLPLAISIRRTNVYEEQSLGVYVDEPQNDAGLADLENTRVSYIGTHLRKQLSFDLWFLFLGLFIICISESAKLDGTDPRFSIFSVLFEITSAYGTVGLSLGYPNFNTSFCGQFNTLSKLTVIAMMIRGRHRGLPYSIDRSVMLPTGNTRMRDDFQAQQVMRRTQTLQSLQALNSEMSAGRLSRSQPSLIRVNTTSAPKIDREKKLFREGWTGFARRASTAAGELTRKIFSQNESAAPIGPRHMNPSRGVNNLHPTISQQVYRDSQPNSQQQHQQQRSHNQQRYQQQQYQQHQHISTPNITFNDMEDNSRTDYFPNADFRSNNNYTGYLPESFDENSHHEMLSEEVGEGRGYNGYGHGVNV